jgi:uncharacterized protein YggE
MLAPTAGVTPSALTVIGAGQAPTTPDVASAQLKLIVTLWFVQLPAV